MRIVIIGGTGLIGAKLVNRLRESGHAVVPASPRTGVDAVTGEGLKGALARADIVIDVANAPSFADEAVLDFFERSSRNLLAAEAEAGVGHHVALSVVGTERLLASGYFRAKLAQETLIAAGPIPYTLVRATQFFEFLGSIARSAAENGTLRLSSARTQPMLSDDVASALAEIAVSPAVNGTIEIAGPEAFGLDEVVRRFLEATGDRREVVTDPTAPYFGVVLDERSLLPGLDARRAPSHLADWLGRGTSQP